MFSRNQQSVPITRRILAFALTVALILPGSAISAPNSGVKSFAGKLPITELSENEAILHALNRLAFGPRPGDIERIRAMGLEKWIEQQLSPESLDDSGLSARLQRYPTIEMSSAKLLEEFPRPEDAARRAGMSREDIQKMQEERAKQREERQRAMESGEMPGEGMRGRGLQGRDPNMIPRGLEDVKNPQRIILELSMAKTTRAIYSERQLNEVLADFWLNHFNVFAQKGADRWLITEYEREAIRPYTLGKFGDMLQATAKSPAMLFYLDNWLSADPESFARLERELGERRARFQRLFGDNPEIMMGRGGRFGAGRRTRPGQQDPSMRRQPGAPGQPGQPGQVPPQRQRRGLNENYARELMELHTLGVDGGYTQQDIIEVARAFTGWTMRAPRLNPEFHFEERFHDTKPKTILGKKFESGGVKEGQQVLDFLATHPNTAKFISTKLARRFVSDAPPAALVERMAKSFEKSQGDIRATMRTMIYSPEFWARSAYRAKIKKPFELVVSTARAMNADVNIALPLVQWSNRIGEPLYMCQPPTGYSDKAEAWVNTGALLNRLNYSLALAGGRLRGMRVDAEKVLAVDSAEQPQNVLARAIEVFLGAQISKETRATLEKQLSDPQVLRATLDDQIMGVDAGVIAGLVLGTPEFQRK